MNSNYIIRRTHRFLGIILAVQFILWTVSGLYFSWSNMDDIHGDLEKKHLHHVASSINFISPSKIMSLDSKVIDTIVNLELTSFANKTYYIVDYHQNGKHKQGIADVITGLMRSALSKEEAIAIAKENYNGNFKLYDVKHIDSADGHHEFRDRPLPAWCVEVADGKNTHIYINAITGKVDKFRNTGWRIFDFLWMTHVMGYTGRDNISNWLLRIFSVFGLVTVMSGIVLFIISQKKITHYK